jgi:hypothetical protein
MDEQRQESTKSDNENKANDENPSSNETEPSNGKTDINDTPMDESQVTRSLIYNIELGSCNMCCCTHSSVLQLYTFFGSGLPYW